MARVKDNPSTEGFSGKLGNRLVFRHMKDGGTIIATRPDYTDHKWTPDQQFHHSRFQQAVAYARVASKTNPLYAELAEGTPKNAYNLALSDWFHAPVIHDVSRQAGCIRVNATDNVQVTRILITLSDAEGKTIEHGQARMLYDTQWEYATSAPTETSVIVETFDLAGNCTRHEV
jgi:hypothetical protein